MKGRQLPDVVRRSAGPARNPLVAGGLFNTRRTYNKFHVAEKPDRTWEGILFDSAGEMERYKQLVQDEKLGRISDLERQVPIVLVKDEKGKSLLKWKVDFRYIDHEQLVVEDFTGVMTPTKRTNIRICASKYPDVVIRISVHEGTGKSKRIVAFDCIRGKVPIKKRPTKRVKRKLS